MDRRYPPISINIVAWNSMRFLPDLLASIKEQILQDFNVLIVDNGSDDGIETYLREHHPDVTFLRNAKNLGFSVAHNQGIRYALDRWDRSDDDQRYVLVTNPDIIMTSGFVQALVNAMYTDVTIGSCGGKLLRAFGENLNDDALSETVKSDLIDSTGLRPTKNRTCADRGAGEMDKGQYDESEPVFGFSGALCLYRASALRDARYEDEFFDNDFFAYKEDVDLAWRLKRLGWSALYVPSAVAYHYRGMFGKEKMGVWERVKNRRSQSRLRGYYSTRNHWLMLLKNLSWCNALFMFPRLLVVESSRLLYLCLFETSHLRSLFDVIKLLPKMLRKRRDVMKRRKRSSREMRSWFV
jgi:GT2 family glycosyltransferase